MTVATGVRRTMWLAVLLWAAQAVSADTPAESDARFFMLLSYKNVATMGDGYQAVAMLVRRDGALADPAACRDMLRQRGVARASWGDDLAAPVAKGRLAYMVCQALGIKGGLTMRLFGPSERYCLFECQHLELMAGGAVYQHCTGGELVSVIDRADVYQSRHAEGAAEGPKAEPPGADMGDQDGSAGAATQPSGDTPAASEATAGKADADKPAASTVAGQEKPAAETPLEVKGETE